MTAGVGDREAARERLTRLAAKIEDTYLSKAVEEVYGPAVSLLLASDLRTLLDEPSTALAERAQIVAWLLERATGIDPHGRFSLRGAHLDIARQIKCGEHSATAVDGSKTLALLDPNDPASYVCPKCGAQKHEPCVTPTGAEATRTHMWRKELAGLGSTAVPDPLLPGLEAAREAIANQAYREFWPCIAVLDRLIREHSGAVDSAT